MDLEFFIVFPAAIAFKSQVLMQSYFYTHNYMYI